MGLGWMRLITLGCMSFALDGICLCCLIEFMVFLDKIGYIWTRLNKQLGKWAMEVMYQHLKHKYVLLELPANFKCVLIYKQF